MSARKVRCRYLTRRNNEQCSNEIAGEPDDDVLLCPKHLLGAYRQMAAHLQLKRDQQIGDERRGGQS